MRVLVVENDPSVGAVVGAILSDAGHTAAVLVSGRAEAVRTAVERMEPDCVLLDGGGRTAYDTSWAVAAWLRMRTRPVPALMFTVHTEAVIEVRTGVTARSHDFAGVITKPFELEDLLAAVEAVRSAA